MPDPYKPVSRSDPGSVGQVVDLVKEYATQETLGPIRGAKRWLAAGAGGAVLLGTGYVLLVLGLLRMLQNEFGETFSGSWMTMVPYLIALVASLAIIGLAAWRISKKTLQKGS